MSKYIDKEKVLEYVKTYQAQLALGMIGKDVDSGDLIKAIDVLPTIEVSEDCIDRKKLLEQIDKDSEGSPGYYGDTWQFIKTIENAPSVIPKPKVNVETVVVDNEEPRIPIVVDLEEY